MNKKIILTICLVCSFAVGFSFGMIMTANILSLLVEDYRKSSDKFRKLFRLMSQWLQMKQENKHLVSYFEKNDYNNIAIYGMGVIGDIVIKELVNSNVNVVYTIDQRADKNSEGFLVSPDSKLKEADVIVITPITSYGEIKLKLKEKVNCPIISIEDILYEV